MDHTLQTLGHTQSQSQDKASQYVVYVFKRNLDIGAGYVSQVLPAAMERLNWQRDSINDDLVSALTRAEMALQDENVKRVQVFEQKRDKDGHFRTGRMMRHYGPNWLQRLLGLS